MKKRFLTPILLTLFAVALLSSCAVRSQMLGGGAPGAQEIVTVSRGPLSVMIGATGTVRPAQSATLSWQTSGKVGDVDVKPGDVVQAGDVLASLDPASLPQAILQAQVDVINAQKALDDLKMADPLEQAQAQANLEQAQQALKDLQNPSAVTLAQAELNVINAQEAVKDAQYDLDSLTNGRGNAMLISTARANYLVAQDHVDRMQEAYDRTPGDVDEDPQKAMAYSELQGAKNDRDLKLARLNWYLGDPSPQELAEAQTTLQLAQANLAKAQETLARLKTPTASDITLAQAKVDEAQEKINELKGGPDPDALTIAETRLTQAQSSLSQASLSAPFAGTVTEVDALPGDLISPGKSAFRLDDLSTLYIDLQVSEIDIRQVKVGQPVNVTFDAILDKGYQGEVSQLGLVGSSNQGAVYFAVTVRLLDADAAVLPGMTAVADIQVEQREDVLQIPNRAIQEENGKRFVYLMEGEGDQATTRQIYVQIGVTSDTASEIISSELKEGDRISTSSPGFFMGPGAGARVEAEPAGGGGGQP